MVNNASVEVGYLNRGNKIGIVAAAKVIYCIIIINYVYIIKEGDMYRALTPSNGMFKSRGKFTTGVCVCVRERILHAKGQN